MTLDDKNRFQAVVLESFRETGKLLLKEYHSGKRIVDLETDHDLKLELDRRSESIIISLIQAAFPHHAILSEETGLIPGKEAVWMIDPVDGTVNYYYGLPWFCISIGCYRLGTGMDIRDLEEIPSPVQMEPLIAGVFSPVENKLYLTVDREDALLNDQPVSARKLKNISQSLFAMNMGSSPVIIDKMSEILKNAAAAFKKVRLLGSAALDIVSVASGELGVCYYFGLKLWDLAAGIMIVRNSGGKVILNKLSPDSYEVLCYRPELEKELSALFPHLILGGRIQ